MTPADRLAVMRRFDKDLVAEAVGEQPNNPFSKWLWLNLLKLEGEAHDKYRIFGEEMMDNPDLERAIGADFIALFRAWTKKVGESNNMVEAAR